MKYIDWQTNLPKYITEDALWNMEVYKQALFLAELTRADCVKIQRHKNSLALADQLIRAVSSIPANIAEGYSRKSGRDQARYYEYALGSAREARIWYFQSQDILTNKVITHRQEMLTLIIKHLLAIVPKQRGNKLSEPLTPYSIESLLKDAPLD